jgi:hypothetical protein
MPDRTARGVASELIARFGIRAPCVANLQALRARAAGDGDRRRDWSRIAQAALEILRSEPEDAAPQAGLCPEG